MSSVKNDSKVFDLNNWKDRVAGVKMGKTTKNRCARGDQELSFGHVNFMMPFGHPDRCSVGLFVMNTVFFSSDLIVLKQCAHCSENILHSLISLTCSILAKLEYFGERNCLTAFWLCCHQS